MRPPRPRLHPHRAHHRGRDLAHRPRRDRGRRRLPAAGLRRRPPAARGAGLGPRRALVRGGVAPPRRLRHGRAARARLRPVRGSAAAVSGRSGSLPARRRRTRTRSSSTTATRATGSRSDYAAAPQGNAWRVLSISEDEVRVRARKGDTFPEGQILQAVCRAGSGFAYFTVAANTSAANDMDLAIPLKPSVKTDPFLRQDATTAACFGGGEARLYLVDRHRFHVRPGRSRELPRPRSGHRPEPGRHHRRGRRARARRGDRDDPVRLHPHEPDARAARDHGRRDHRDRSGRGRGVRERHLHAPVPTPTGVDPASGSVYAPTSFFPHTVGPPTPEVRLTDHQANIRAVRVALRARSTLPDTRTIGASGFELPALQPELGAELGRHERSVRPRHLRHHRPAAEHDRPRDGRLLEVAMRTRARPPRGNTLLVAMILLTVLSAIGVASVMLASAGAEQRRREVEGGLHRGVRERRAGEDLGGDGAVRDVLSRQHGDGHRGDAARRHHASSPPPTTGTSTRRRPRS